MAKRICIVDDAPELLRNLSEVLQMEGRLGGSDVSFNATSSDDDEHSYVPEDYLAVEDPTIRRIEEADWHEQRENTMREVITQLDARSRDILVRRWLADDGEKAGLQELGDEYGVSAERIRQIEAAAMKKIRKAIEAAA